MKNYADPHNSVIQAVDTLISHALEVGASDIHIEPTAHELRVRIRIDGMLQDLASIAHERSAQFIARLKVLARIDTAESRLPQDGTFTIQDSSQCSSRCADVRVSTFPTIYGQKVVVRLLNRAQAFLQLNELGLPSNIYTHIKHIIDRPQGLFLVTGPTGSGKTTTLYALLSYLNQPHRNIVTLEDPVEYHIEGVAQGHINERIGFDFAHGIRSILRQDPDIIMVGEIRDGQTAQTAIRAALTGHLVLSTLHTNDAPSAAVRLIDMGIPPYLLTSALSGVLAQRLMRVLCSCKQQKKLSREQHIFAQELGVDIHEAYVPIGCCACAKTGYKGREGIFECLILDDVVQKLISNNAPLDKLRSCVSKQGGQRLIIEALMRVKNGVTSFDEVMRVCEI